MDLWSRITEIPSFGADRAKEKTVAAQPVLLKALAKIAYDLNFSNRKPENATDLWDKFLSALPEVDFSHSNPAWRYYTLTEEERRDGGIDTLADYLPFEAGTANRDLGAYQGGLMRFGAKHNDIFPLLSDMVRWMTGLPARREVLDIKAL